eukprot:TRINITY_DN3447_c0_g1_i1.p1 TRINITY_DN3447_c0_g1~~TRINITY_DN3447_c0_g1_i1.p1  ORF type:complete len:541 (-),score=172.43 TRINITY_DN3447_c0_g1_i1:151-1773(-)
MPGDIEDVPCTGRCAGCPSKAACTVAASSCAAETLGSQPGAGSPGTSRPSVYDVIIVGGGVIGCAIARYLSRFKGRVLLLEKAADVAAGASKANSGIIHGGYDAPFGTLKATLGWKGNRMYPQLDRELHFGFKEIGSLVLAFSPEESALLNELAVNGAKIGVDGLKIIDGDEVRRLEPSVNPAVHSALLCTHAGVVSPYELTIALAENAIQNGVDILLKHEVVDIQRDAAGGRRFTVKTNDGTSFHSHFVVNAAGLNSDKVAAMVGANDFVILPRKGEFILLEKGQSHFANRVLFPVPSPKLGKGILVSPTYHGNLLLGPTSRDLSLPAERARSSEDVVRLILSQARRTVPGFDASRAITSYAGLRARTDRGDFIVEESRFVPGFVNVAGIDSPGLTSAPAIAEMVGDILRRAGATLEPDARFVPSWRPIIVPKTDDYEGTLTNPDPRLRTICICERVTEAEIVDALHRGLPAASIDAIKKRTRAGMGRCQGMRCEAKVKQLIAREAGMPVDRVPSRGLGSSILPHQRLTEVDRQLLAKL